MEWLFKPIYVDWQVGYWVGFVLFITWLIPLISLVRKSIRIAEHCRRSGEDEVDVIFSRHPLGISWWRSLLAWYALTMMWGGDIRIWLNMLRMVGFDGGL